MSIVHPFVDAIAIVAEDLDAAAALFGPISDEGWRPKIKVDRVDFEEALDAELPDFAVEDLDPQEEAAVRRRMLEVDPSEYLDSEPDWDALVNANPPESPWLASLARTLEMFGYAPVHVAGIVEHAREWRTVECAPFLHPEDRVVMEALIPFQPIGCWNLPDYAGTWELA
jgi:hypothetical protein